MQVRGRAPSILCFFTKFSSALFPLPFLQRAKGPGAPLPDLAWGSRVCVFSLSQSFSRMRRPISRVPMGMTPGSAMSAVRQPSASTASTGVFDGLGLRGQVEGVAEHHGHRQDGGDGVGLVLAGDVRSGAVDGLIQAGGGCPR